MMYDLVEYFEKPEFARLVMAVRGQGPAMSALLLAPESSWDELQDPAYVFRVLGLEKNRRSSAAREYLLSQTG